jgi:hypothetical protein
MSGEPAKKSLPEVPGRYESMRDFLLYFSITLFL